MNTPAPQLPGSLKSNPRLSQWLRVDPQGYVEIAPGKVEIGQGILTALVQIAADELDVSRERVRLKAASTAYSPNEGVTSGSLSIQDCGTALRHVCAQTRDIYLARAAEKLGLGADTLRIEDGEIRGPGNAATSYWELADASLLDRDATPGIKAKAPESRALAGTSATRLDIPEKAFGQPRFIHDRLQAGVLHGRVLRPPGPGARLVALDDNAARKIEGHVATVRDGSFAGVIARGEFVALKAVEALRKGARWDPGEPLPDWHGLKNWLKSARADSNISAE